MTNPGQIQWLSPANYAYRAMAQLGLQGLNFRCTTFGPNGGKELCLVSGQDGLEMFDVYYPAAWICILILLGWLVVYHLLAIVGLQVTTKKKPIMF